MERAATLDHSPHSGPKTISHPVMNHRIPLPRILKSVSLGDPDRPLDASRKSPVVRHPDPPAVPARDATAEQAVLQAAWQQLLSGLGSLDDQLQELELRRKQSLVEMQQAAIELALAIASRIVHETIEADDLALDAMVADILARCDTAQTAVLRLHPLDLALLNGRLEGKPPPWQDFSSFQLIGDAGLQRGECRVDAGDFGILSQIEMQLTEIRQQLLETLDHAQVERRRPQTGDRTLRRFPDRRETA